MSKRRNTIIDVIGKPESQALALLVFPSLVTQHMPSTMLQIKFRNECLEPEGRLVIFKRTPAFPCGWSGFRPSFLFLDDSPQIES